MCVLIKYFVSGTLLILVFYVFFIVVRTLTPMSGFLRPEISKPKEQGSSLRTNRKALSAYLFGFHFMVFTTLLYHIRLTVLVVTQAFIRHLSFMIGATVASFPPLLLINLNLEKGKLTKAKKKFRWFVFTIFIVMASLINLLGRTNEIRQLPIILVWVYLTLHTALILATAHQIM